MILLAAAGDWQLTTKDEYVVTEERVITSEEHDALIAGMSPDASAGATERVYGGRAGRADRAAHAAKQVKSYDFRRPEKFSRDQLRTLRGIHDQLIRLLNASLAAYLRTSVEMSLQSVDQVSYEEFAAEAQEGNLIYVIQLDPLPAPMMLEVSTSLVFSSLDRLLGGSGRRLLREREPTDIEKELFRENWLGPLLESVCTAWQNIVTLEPTVTTVETNAGFVHIALPTDVVVSIGLGARIGDAEGRVRLCYTYATLEPIIPQLDTQRLIAAGQTRRRPDDSENVRRGLRSIQVPIVARLGVAEVTMEELLGLQVGDVIRLHTMLDSEVDLLINGELKYRGRPGLKRHRVAVRIGESVQTEGGAGSDPLGNEESAHGAE
jgi:flagellar motor switch protein FliM